MKKITVLIPCHNEAVGIAKVLKAMPNATFTQFNLDIETIVIDNNSTDATAKVATKLGATVISETKQGKGNALKAGFNAVSKDTDYVVILDGDDTYKPGEILRLIEPLMHDFCHVVIGSRLGGKMKAGSLRFFNRLGNWLFTFLVRTYYQTNTTDALSGYIAMKKEVLDTIKPYLTSEGFAIEMELITKLSRFGYSAYSVPITYDHRAGESKLSALKDGLTILKTFFINLQWHPTKIIEPFTDAVEAKKPA